MRAKMSKFGLYQWGYSHKNREVGFVTNVIQCHMSNPYRKMLGLFALACNDRVGAGNSIDTVCIDGSIQPIGKLEEYA